MGIYLNLAEGRLFWNDATGKKKKIKPNKFHYIKLFKTFLCGKQWNKKINANWGNHMQYMPWVNTLYIKRIGKIR